MKYATGLLGFLLFLPCTGVTVGQSPLTGLGYFFPPNTLGHTLTDIWIHLILKILTKKNSNCPEKSKNIQKTKHTHMSALFYFQLKIRIKWYLNFLSAAIQIMEKCINCPEKSDILQKIEHTHISITSYFQQCIL